MSCGYCGHRFDATQWRASCSGCAFVGGGCRMVRCPRCRYEMPEPVSVPRPVQKLLARFGLAAQDEE